MLQCRPFTAPRAIGLTLPPSANEPRKATMKDNETVSLSRLHEAERILVTAHRGNSLEYPENTLLSMEKAVEAGADFIEFDLFATKDNVPILLHDPTLKRTANAEGRPEDRTLAEIKSLNASWFRHMHRMDAPLPEKVEIPTFRQSGHEHPDIPCFARRSCGGLPPLPRV